MGLNLTILPAFRQESDFSHCLLKFDRDYNMFNEIIDKAHEFGCYIKEKGICTHLSRNGDGITKCDAYGHKLKYITADHLKDVVKRVKTESWRNNAIIAFINELPDDLPVYLYWN